MNEEAFAEGTRLRGVLGLFVVSLGTLIAPLDSSVNIAFPAITRGFGVPLDSIQWVVICYVLTHSSLMLVFGKMGDLFGRRRIFGFGLFTSTVAFALCGLAETFGSLLVFRVLQGVGVALVISCGPALATALFPEALRGRILGLYTLMFGVGGALGPSVGGFLVAEWGWSAVFWFRVPIAAAALLLLLLLPKPRPSSGPRRFDTVGAVLLTVGLSTFLLALNQARHAAGDGLFLAMLLGLIAAACLFAFVRQERRAPEPILRPGLFRDPGFAVVNLTNAVVNLVGFSVMLLVPFFLDRMTGLSIMLAGAVLASSPAGMVIAGPLGGHLLARVAARRLAFIGAVLVGVALLSIGQWTGATPIPAMVINLVAVGFGLGLYQVAYLEIVTGTLPRGDRGVAGSLTMVTRTVGVVSGATGLTLLFSGFATDGAAAGGPMFLAPFTATFTTAGAALLAVLAVTLLYPRIWFAAMPRR